MSLRIAAPTYIFRDRLPQEMDRILDDLAGIGYEGVELAGFFGHSPEAVQKALANSGLAAAGNNVPIYELMKDSAGAVAIHKELGFYSLTAGGLRDEHLPGGERYAETREWMEELGTLCREAGIRFLYHNHWKEVKWRSEGLPLLDLLLRDLDPSLLSLQPDLGWMQIGGADPLAYLACYRDRCPMIHVKDFYASDIAKIGDPFDLNGKRGGTERGNFEFRPTGFGISNIPAQIPAIRACRPDWIVTCHDNSYERDRLEDLKLCYAYLSRLLAISDVGDSCEREA